VGGVNATSGFDAPSSVNPWDFILMIEGALLFAATTSRRLESSEPGALIYPFCVRQAGVGYASAAAADEEAARAEMWLPLWECPTTVVELRTVFSEGRALVNGRPARNGVDFSRAVVTLGVDRGLSSFQRYGFQVRNGLAYFATPLERVIVRRNCQADLLSEIDIWLDALRRKAGPLANPPAPTSVSRALNQLDTRILDLCKCGTADSLRSVLIALGRCERALARSLHWAQDTAQLRPLSGLSPTWLREVVSNSPEFRLAAALASISGLYGQEMLPMRGHLEPVVIKKTRNIRRGAWVQNPGNDVVWHEGHLVDVLNRILARRLIHAIRTGTRGLPDTSAWVHLSDIAAFIDGETDDGLLADLLWGMSFIDWPAVQPGDLPRRKDEQLVPSSLYAMLKLALHRPAADEEAVPLVPAIHQWAAQGDGTRSSRFAARRLRASGFAPAVQTIPLSGPTVQRTAAALLFPLSSGTIEILQKAVLRPQLQPN
jgi:CRISPR-associated protein Csx17